MWGGGILVNTKRFHTQFPAKVTPFLINSLQSSSVYLQKVCVHKCPVLLGFPPPYRLLIINHEYVTGLTVAASCEKRRRISKRAEHFIKRMVEQYCGLNQQDGHLRPLMNSCSMPL